MYILQMMTAIRNRYRAAISTIQFNIGTNTGTRSRVSTQPSATPGRRKNAASTGM